MNGQWIGKYTGTTSGTLIVNVDSVAGGYAGAAYLIEDNPAFPSTLTYFERTDREPTFKLRTGEILALDPNSGLFDSWDNVKKHFTDVGVSGYADVTGSVNDDTMSLSWITEGGAEGSSVLPRSTADKPSTLTVLGAVRDWATYKAHVGSLEHRRFIFRGQNEPWRLRTSYHRTGRADLRRFLAQDVQVLHRHLSARTRHVFNLSVPDENGAFFNLVQHHGYPTPLLDWTYSPYVAAFFAFRDITNKQAAKAGPTEKVRIHVLDQAMWKKDWAQLQDLLPAGLHLSVSEFVSIENERLIPQQAVSTLTNIDDIESYVKDREELSGKSYLVAIDLPVQERANVVRELSSMGITAGSLFPGLDGACEELTERNFNI